MAEKRMLSKKVIQEDKFLLQPLSTQALYMHLNSETDDDGFVNNSKMIQRYTQASEEDYILLIKNGYVIEFEEAVLLAHFLINNTLRNDRYKKSPYHHYLNQVEKNEQNIFRLKNVDTSTGNQMETIGIPSDNQLEPQQNLTEQNITEHNKTTTGTKDKTKETDPAVADYKKGINFYQNNFGVINPHTAEDLQMWIEDIGIDLVIEALKRATENQKNYAYAKGIMRNWVKNNIKTMKDVEAQDVAFTNKKQGYKQSTNDELEEWDYQSEIYGENWQEEQKQLNN